MLQKKPGKFSKVITLLLWIFFNVFKLSWLQNIYKINVTITVKACQNLYLWSKFALYHCRVGIEKFAILCKNICVSEIFESCSPSLKLE